MSRIGFNSEQTKKDIAALKKEKSVMFTGQLNRTNPNGLKFVLDGMIPGITVIRFGQKSISVPYHIDDVSQWWFNWQIKGNYIQVAFSEFTPSEREFIMTGITPQEWNELFDEVEEEN